MQENKPNPTETFLLIVDEREFTVKFTPFYYSNMHFFEFYGAGLNDRSNRTWLEFANQVDNPQDYAKKKIREMVEENRAKQEQALVLSNQRLEKLILKFNNASDIGSLYENLTGKQSRDLPKTKDLFISWLKRQYAKKVLGEGILWQTLFRQFISNECWEESDIPDYKQAQLKNLGDRREILIAEIEKFSHPEVTPKLRDEWINWVRLAEDNSEHPAISWEKFQNRSPHEITRLAIAQLLKVARVLSKKKAPESPLTYFADKRLFEYDGYVFNAVRTQFIPEQMNYQAFAFNRWGDEFNGLSAKADTFDEALSLVRERIASGYQEPMHRRPKLWFPKHLAPYLPALPNLDFFIQTARENPECLVFQKEGVGEDRESYLTYFEQAYVASRVSLLFLFSKYFSEVGAYGAYVPCTGFPTESSKKYPNSSRKFFGQLKDAGFHLKITDARHLTRDYKGSDKCYYPYLTPEHQTRIQQFLGEIK
jgi:hypothetical protein